MVSEKFRRQLRQEAQLWQAEALIDASVYEQLSARYQFDSLERAASNRFVMILLGLGGILLGIGVITFVAANWQYWSKAVKTGLLLSLLIGVDIAGFYLWRQFPTLPGFTPLPAADPKRQKWHRLGHGLLIFGALILGANLALMAQMFHIGGASYKLYLVWGLGVLAMAYSLRLTSLGVMAILLIAISYGLGWFDWSAKLEFSWLRVLLEHTALFTAGILVPLAYWCRSRVIFVMAALLLIPTLQFSLAAFSLLNLSDVWWFILAWTVPPALLWSYNDALLPNLTRISFRSLARSLAIWFFSFLFYWLSFHGFWEALAISEPSGKLSANDLSSGWLVFIDPILLIGLAAWQWYHLLKPSQNRPHHWGLDATTIVIVGFLLMSGIVGFWHLEVSRISTVATFVFNVQLFLVAAGLIRIGLAKIQRGTFWGGLVLLTLQIISRVLEYQTELILKSFVFLLCGIGVMAAGLWFEKHLSQPSTSQH